MPEMNPGICQNIAEKYARKIARFPLCRLVLKLQSLWLQREVTRTKARLRPTVPKIYKADGGGNQVPTNLELLRCRWSSYLWYPTLFFSSFIRGLIFPRLSIFTYLCLLIEILSALHFCKSKKALTLWELYQGR